MGLRRGWEGVGPDPQQPDDCIDNDVPRGRREPLINAQLIAVCVGNLVAGAVEGGGEVPVVQTMYFILADVGQSPWKLSPYQLALQQRCSAWVALKL